MVFWRLITGFCCFVIFLDIIISLFLFGFLYFLFFLVTFCLLFLFRWSVFFSFLYFFFLYIITRICFFRVFSFITLHIIFIIEIIQKICQKVFINTTFFSIIILLCFCSFRFFLGSCSFLFLFRFGIWFVFLIFFVSFFTSRVIIRIFFLVFYFCFTILYFFLLCIRFLSAFFRVFCFSFYILQVFFVFTFSFLDFFLFFWGFCFFDFSIIFGFIILRWDIGHFSVYIEVSIFVVILRIFYIIICSRKHCVISLLFWSYIIFSALPISYLRQRIMKSSPFFSFLLCCLELFILLDLLLCNRIKSGHQFVHRSRLIHQGFIQKLVLFFQRSGFPFKRLEITRLIWQDITQFIDFGLVSVDNIIDLSVVFCQHQMFAPGFLHQCQVALLTFLSLLEPLILSMDMNKTLIDSQQFVFQLQYMVLQLCECWWIVVLLESFWQQIILQF